MISSPILCPLFPAHISIKLICCIERNCNLITYNVCPVGFPSVGRALWLSLFDVGERGPVDGRVRVRRAAERRERPWRSRVCSSSAGQYVHDLHWRQHFGRPPNQQQELVLPRPIAGQSPRPLGLLPPNTSATATTAAAATGQLLVQRQKFPVVAGCSCRTRRKVLLFVQRQHGQHATSQLLTVVAGWRHQQHLLQPGPAVSSI